MFLPSSNSALQTFRRSCVYNRHKMFVISRKWTHFIYEIYGWLELRDGRTHRYMYLPNAVLIHKRHTGRERARDLGLSVYRNPCQQTADWRMSELYKWSTKTRTRLLLTKINFNLLWKLHFDWLDSSGFVWTGFNMRLLTVRNIANEFHGSEVKLESTFLHICTVYTHT